MKDRAIRAARPAAVVAAVGFAYLLLHELTGFALFCPFRRFLHVYCPGCGVSRMCFHLAHFEIAEAFSSNCVVFCMAPILLIAWAYHTYRYIRYGKRGLSKAENIVLYIFIAVLLVFGIARNIWSADWLIP